MDQGFLNRLTEIIDTNLENENFGPTDVYHAIGMSRSNIHRKLSSITHQSLSQYIQEKRLQKAMNMLRQNSATASEIAFRTGFSSPEYFNRCFREYYGYPPGEVKKIESNGYEKPNHGIAQDPETQISNWRGESLHNNRRKLYLITSVLTVLIILVVLILAYLSNNSFFEKTILAGNHGTKNIDKSILVLPFKNISPDPDNQYFTDGVMEDILSYLSRMKELRIISRTTAEHFRGSTLTAGEIAKIMDINYILEGSVQKYLGKVRINVNLIDVHRDRSKWSDKYDMELNDLFKSQQDIAKQIASELKAVLSVKETKQIEKSPTRNLEAYNLYLKGRFFREKRTEDGFKKSVYYFEKSIAEDPDFALAYSGLADIYFLFPFDGWYPKSERYAKVKELVSHAIKIDNTLGEAHAILGNLLAYSEYNWEEARKEFMLAIDCKPSDATSHLYYAEFLEVTGQSDEARSQINLALELDPLSLYILEKSANFYYYKGDFEKSLIELQKMEEIDPNLIQMIWTYVNIYVSQKNYSKAVDVIEKFYMASPLLNKDAIKLKDIFNNSGMDGVMKVMLELELKHFRRPMALAVNYAWLHDNDKAIEWLWNAYDVHDPAVCWICCYPSLRNLQSEPGFWRIMDKTGLSYYHKNIRPSKIKSD